MFTGIIEELGTVTDWVPSADAARITVHAPLAVSDAKHGDSISVSGVCLTVVDQGTTGSPRMSWPSRSPCRPSAALTAGTLVNLERAAKVGDRIGGHIVQGHIDGTAQVLEHHRRQRLARRAFALDPELAALVTRKGSVAIDGISLTVSAVGDDWFEVSLIPETLEVTTLGARLVGDRVNLETDILARQVQRLLFLGAEDDRPTSSVSAPQQPDHRLLRNTKTQLHPNERSES